MKTKTLFYCITLIFISNFYKSQTWQTTFGTNGNDYAYSIAKTPDRGYVICGSSDGFPSLDSSAFIIKIDSVSNLIWSKSYKIGKEFNKFVSIAVAQDSSIIVGGENYGMSFYNSAIYKLNSTGNISFTKKDTTRYSSVSRQIFIMPSNDYLIGGGTCARMSSNGSFIWSKYIGSDITTFDNLSDGNYVGAGGTGALSGYASIVKFDNNGDTLWTRYFDNYGLIQSISANTNGYFYCIGYNGKISKFDNSGTWLSAIIL